MKPVGRTLAASLAFALLTLAAPTAAAASTAPAAAIVGATATGTGSNDYAATANTASATPLDALTDCSAAFFDGDPRLGPQQLPALGIVGLELLGYQRTGDLTPQQFLAQYYNPAANGGKGGWIYPPDNGYLLVNGQPVEWTQTLLPGEDIDRYGSEYGSFLAPAGSPYATRAIPPQSLDGTPAAGCNYHDYRVLKAFAVHAGPIAAWFAQPGDGLQYQLDAALIPGAPTPINVMWLINNGYLERLV